MTDSDPSASGSVDMDQLTTGTRRLLVLALVLGVVLRSMQYFGGTDFWHDELAVVRNILDKDAWALLTQPMDHFQVAPAGFLVLTKICVAALGDGWAGFRLFPYLVGVLGLFLFWRVAQRFATGSGLVAAVTLFAVSPALTWYGGSVKPYIGDVTVSILLCLLALRFRERCADSQLALRDGVVAGIVGALVMQISFPAVPTAALVGGLLVVDHRRRGAGAPWTPLVVIGALWTAGAGFATWSAKARVPTQTDGMMRDFWDRAFPPYGDLLAWPGWVVDRIYDGFSHFLVHARPPWFLAILVVLPLVLAGIGLFGAWRQRERAALLLLVPTVAGLGAAVLGVLPFSHRLALHAGWPILVLAGLGVRWMSGRATGRRRVAVQATAWIEALPITLLVLGVAIALGRPPHSVGGRGGPSVVIGEMAAAYQPGDLVYAFVIGGHDMAYYGPRSGIGEVILGARHPEDPRAFLREVDALRGAPRAWVFWSQLGTNPRTAPDLILRYLGAIGREVQRLPGNADPKRIGAVLFDLSDAERMQAFDADSFPIDDE